MIELTFETVEIRHPNTEPEMQTVHALVSSKEEVYLVAARLFNRTHYVPSVGLYERLVTHSIAISAYSMKDYLQLPTKDFQK
jgi:hypothetical protein